MSVDLQQARDLFAAGDDRKAIGVLWNAKEAARGSKDETQEVLDLACAIRDRASRRIQKNADRLVQSAELQLARLAKSAAAAVMRDLGDRPSLIRKLDEAEALLRWEGPTCPAVSNLVQELDAAMSMPGSPYVGAEAPPDFVEARLMADRAASALDERDPVRASDEVSRALRHLSSHFRSLDARPPVIGWERRHHSPLESPANLLAAAGVPEGALGDGTLLGEAVVLLRGPSRRSLMITDREGRQIGSAVRSDSATSSVYTFYDTEQRFVLTPPPGVSVMKSLRSRDAAKASMSFKLTTIDGVELTLPWYSVGPIERDGETIARAIRCRRSEFVGAASRWSGIKEWRLINRADAEIARITFLRQRNLGYVLNATVLLGSREDRVNYVVQMAPGAQDIERAGAIALAIIIDTTLVGFLHAGDD